MLAAVIAAFVVTQLAIVATTVLGHGALTHRAWTTHPVPASVRRSSRPVNTA